MDFPTLLGSITTVVAFVSFLAIVAWAYSRKRKSAFDAAAMAPFALPDEHESRPAHRQNPARGHADE